MEKFVQFLLAHLTEVVLVLSVFVEITPIRINPISTFLRFIGKTINADLKEEVDKLSLKVDENSIDRIRWEILSFANSCRQGKKHTYDEFKHIIDLNTKYHGIIEARGLTNGQIDLEYAYIERIFKQCQLENKFL